MALLGEDARCQFFTVGEEGTHSGEFEFEHLPNARLADEDDENEKWQENVQYVGGKGTFETGFRHEGDDLCRPGHTHQQEETQDHFKSEICVEKSIS